MLRSALVLSVALAVLCGGDAALAARTTLPIAGDVRAVAFTGEALAIAYLPPRGGLTVERFAGNAIGQPLLGTSLRAAEDEIQLAGSPQALAVGLQPDAEANFASSRVFVGPAAGPLREVSVCAAGLLPPPVAVAGAAVAWRDGGCGDPVASPNAITPAALMIAAVDPAIAPTRIALDPNVLPVSLVLADGGGMVGALRPSFFAVDSEVRAFSLANLQTTLVAERSAIVSPIGVLANGTRVFSLSRLNVSERDADDEACPNSLFTIRAGDTQRRELAAGGCLLGADAPSGPSSARVGTDRAYAVVGEPARGSSAGPPRISVVSLGADGGERRVHASGSYRPPRGIAADGDRLAYWHRRCTDDGSDVVVVDGAGQDAGPGAISSCRARVLTRRARVSDGRISLQLRCPAGCRGVAVDAGGERPRRLRSFSLQAGTHALRIALSSAVRRRGRLRLELIVEHGPARLVEIRLRR
jgi:hypothetical protein